MKNNKMPVIAISLVVLLLITGVVVYKAVFSAKTAPPVVEEEEIVDTLPPADPSILVTLVKSAKANTVVLSASGLKGNINSVGYELSYDSQGLIKGVQSGSKPIETVGKDTFEREVYLGTCSKNDCKPDVGVTKVSVVLEFTDKDGKKSQFSKDFDL